jgi:hypothetical protein
MRVNAFEKWLWSKKPHSLAMSETSLDDVSSRRRAALMRAVRM